MGGRYYSPKMKSFISPCNISEILYNISVPGNLNLYTIGNPMYFPVNRCNIETSIPLVYDPPQLCKFQYWIYSSFRWYNSIPWWQKTLVGTGLFVAGLGITVTTGGAALPYITCFAIGVGVGTAIGTGIGLAQGNSFGDALLDGFGNSVLLGGIFSFGSASINAIRRIPAYRFLRTHDLTHKQTREALRAFKRVPKVTTLGTDTEVYRIWGGDSGMYGHWVSPNNYGSAARSLLALPPGNTMANLSSFIVLSGTRVLTGTAAAMPLWGLPGGGIQWWVALLG